MNRILVFLAVLIILFILSCKKKPEMDIFPAHHPSLIWHGRNVQDKAGHRQLISSASYLKFRFVGDDCKVWLKNEAPGDGYNYISLVLDGIHQDRMPIHFDTFTPLEIKTIHKAPYHDLELYKETEAVCGLVVIGGIQADSLKPIPVGKRKKIEFIGNSITVGMAADPSLIPCERGTWYDQHNAYEAYGPRVARALDLDYMVNGVSGIGVYRNWNTDGPTIGSVYELAYMNANPLDKHWDFEQFIPDIVSICLGTNDVSDGDGITPRPPFDSVRFINTYVIFLENIHSHYPDARILLLSSPVAGELNMDMLNACLMAVKQKAELSIAHLRSISVFSFKMFHGAGCTGHPSVEDHESMAGELIPFIKKLMEKG